MDNEKDTSLQNGDAATQSNTAGNTDELNTTNGNINGNHEMNKEGQNRNSGNQPRTSSSFGAKTEQAKKTAHTRFKFAKKQAKDKKEKVKHSTTTFSGGHDDTPIPKFSGDTYIVRFTFHRAENLPISDINSRSTDAYIHATLSTFLPKRHREDNDLILRTKTVHKDTNPKWEQQWVVAGIPSDGFRLKCRLYDEDPTDHDDRLGNVTVYAHKIYENWPGLKEEGYDIKKRMGSKRAYTIQACISAVSKDVHLGGKLYLSAEILGKTDGFDGRMYTIGPGRWIKHNSAMMGRLAGTKDAKAVQANIIARLDGEDTKRKPTEKYDFQANELQLQGPVPASLYHRYVEYKPIMKGMFVRTTLRGRLLNSALHHQHRRVYNYSRNTEYGDVEMKSEEAAKKFLEMTHYDEESRVFSYVISLDGLFRFTETGKEFGIDLLSKHSMHSDVSNYIAYSGEFFIRRAGASQSKGSESAPANQAEHAERGDSNASSTASDTPHSSDPKDYELVIDNDSGTYRPKGALLPDLQKFLSENFPSLHITTKERSDDTLQNEKQERRELRKKKRKEKTKKKEGQ